MPIEEHCARCYNKTIDKNKHMKGATTMGKERTISIKELTCNTYSVKDNSVRGCHTASGEEVKVGDMVLLDNYFTLVTE